MTPWWAWAMFVFGINFMLWGFVGLCRLTEPVLGKARRLYRRVRRKAVPRFAVPARTTLTLPPGPGWKTVVGRSEPAWPTREPVTIDDVAVLIPAHNESAVIGDSLAAITRLVPRANVHVVSDGSTDDTVEIAAAAGVRVMRTPRNLGKAGALEAAIHRFDLVHRFAAVLLLDADTRIEPGYFAAALPLFDDPEVVAVAGCVRTELERGLTRMGATLVAHRQRIYSIGQRLLKYGQTWLRINATHIVPGFASLYRTEILPKIDINPPGLVIEDFNMTFEVYQKRLGKVAFTLRATAVTQDPDTLGDYLRQIRRWSVGLWQTVWRHRPQANLFTVMVVLMLAEQVFASLLYTLLPLVALVLATHALPVVGAWPPLTAVYGLVSAHVNWVVLAVGVLVPDYLITCLAAAVERQPRLLRYGLFFLPLRVADAAVFLYAVPRARFTRSSGRWRSPARRPTRPPAPAATDMRAAG
ncbi:glycosyltransferase [Amycolatopsis sp. K13G38]|uniref:Glycosyltransferase n=1 Tax=Amycolatopsis acididurans TaxID=2724524 RepID=A0ABX1J8L0_9PSEU|nr:glycosyltransferase family 2 protein [Amycolatopsis acididurans]NKQ56048.1 glycosyltransferase [Amycolatopsis acididurans]